MPAVKGMYNKGSANAFNTLVGDSYDVNWLVRQTVSWYSSFLEDPDAEYTHWFFGKNSRYTRKDNSVSDIWHVHLVPNPTLVHSNENKNWNKKHKTQSRKTSNRILIYSIIVLADIHYIYLIDVMIPGHVPKNATLKEKDAFIKSQYLKIENAEILINLAKAKLTSSL